MSDKVYPYISKLITGEIFLHYEKDKALAIDALDKTGTQVDCIEARCKNITHEYLANTWGVVESPEHAEFIRELAVNCMVIVDNCGDHSVGREFFCFHTGTRNNLFLLFCDEEAAKDNNEKQITIPMPPKSEVESEVKQESEFKIKLKEIHDRTKEKAAQIAKEHNNPFYNATIISELNGLVKIDFEADRPVTSSSPEEWPLIQDEVLINIDTERFDVVYGHNVDGKVGVVRSIFNDGDTKVYAVSVDGVCYCFTRGLLEKPKTPDEELTSELIAQIKSAGDLNWYAIDLAEFLVKHYNITKKPD